MGLSGVLVKLFLDLAASNMGMLVLSKFIELTPLCTHVWS